MQPTPASITPTEAAARPGRGVDWLLLDVREDDELAIASLPDAVQVPLGQLADRLETLATWRDRPVLCLCHHGVRSRYACQLLTKAGFREAINISGGIDRWSCDVDPQLPRY